MLLWFFFALPLLHKSKSLPPIIGTLIIILVNKAGLGLQNLATSANEKFLSSRRDSMELITSMTVEITFSTADQLQSVKEERSDIRKHGIMSTVPN